LSELCILVWSKAFEQTVQYLSASAGIAANWAKGLHLRYFFVSKNHGMPAILARVDFYASRQSGAGPLDGRPSEGFPVVRLQRRNGIMNLSLRFALPPS
jgi:hypothetical protein